MRAGSAKRRPSNSLRTRISRYSVKPAASNVPARNAYQRNLRKEERRAIGGILLSGALPPLCHKSFYVLPSPTVSAAYARRAPIGLSRPLVVSLRVWRSVSPLISAPISTAYDDSKNHMSRITTAPAAPYVSL